MSAATLRRISTKALTRYQVILLGEQRHIRCEQLAQGCCPNSAAVGVEPATSRSRVQRSNHYTTEPRVTSNVGLSLVVLDILTHKSRKWVVFPTFLWCPPAPLRGTRKNFYMKEPAKIRRMGWKLHSPNFSRFWLIHPFVSQTDRETDER